VNVPLGLVDGLGGLPERRVGCQVERDGDDGKLSLVIDGQGAALHFEASDGAEGNGGAIHRGYSARIGRTRTGRGVRGSGRARRSGGGRIAGSRGRGDRLGTGSAGSECGWSQSRTNVEVLQFRGVLPKFGLRFKHDMVLVQLGVQGGNLPLPISVV